MRTWFNALPPRHHADAASLKQLPREQPPHAKKRVPMPGGSEAPYALANETGCPEGISRLPDAGACTLEGAWEQGGVPTSNHFSWPLRVVIQIATVEPLGWGEQWPLQNTP